MASIRITMPSDHCRTVRPSLPFMFRGLPIDLLAGVFARRFRPDFFQAMAGAGVEIKIVELLQFANAFERSRAEGSLSVEGMKDDAFEHVAERHVVIFGKGFKNF